MEVMNNIIIVQNLSKLNNGQEQNEYHFYTQTRIYLGGVILPSDRQFMADSKALNIITRAMALRWQLIPPRQVRQVKQG